MKLALPCFFPTVVPTIPSSFRPWQMPRTSV
jgi:hypothetical protein